MAHERSRHDRHQCIDPDGPRRSSVQYCLADLGGQEITLIGKFQKKRSSEAKPAAIAMPLMSTSTENSNSSGVGRLIAPVFRLV